MQLIDGAPVYSATDLVGFLACGHRFELERAALAGLVTKPIRSDPTIELVQARGYEHEKRYRADLRAASRRVVEIPRDGSAANTRAGLDEAAELTFSAMLDGADVVYQATFFDGTWRGHADFLLRVDHAPGEADSALGAWHYEVADTKLARHVKASAVVQICSYVDQLSRVQGRQPERLHVALGGSARETVVLRVDDFMAYYRRVKADFLAAADERRVGAPAYPPANTYPDPVAHCDVCRWWATCRDRRRADDDLSLVARITGRQRRALKERAVDLPPGPGCASRPGSRSRARAAARCSGSCSTRSGPSTRSRERGRWSPIAGSWSSRSRRRTTCSSTSRAIRSRSTTGSTTCSASSTLPPRRATRGGRPTAPARRRRRSMPSGASTPTASSPSPRRRPPSSRRSTS